MNQAHYVCKGDCKGVSKNPGTCHSDYCNMYGTELEKCDCQNEEHKIEEEGAE